MIHGASAAPAPRSSDGSPDATQDAGPGRQSGSLLKPSRFLFVGQRRRAGVRKEKKDRMFRILVGRVLYDLPSIDPSPRHPPLKTVEPRTLTHLDLLHPPTQLLVPQPHLLRKRALVKTLRSLLTRRGLL